MSKSTLAELRGVLYGAVGVEGPLALQSALNKVRKTTSYTTLSDATNDLAPREIEVVEVAGAPTWIAKNAAGTAFSLTIAPGGGGGPAAAGTLTGNTLAANVVTSSLTSVGTLINLTVTNPIVGNGSLLTAINASNIASGTLSDGRLPTVMSGKTLTNTTFPVSAQSGTILDFAGDSFKIYTLSANTVFTTANRVPGKSLTVRITGGASVWNTTFPAWAFVGAAAPANIAIGKVGILTITSFGTTDADCVAAFAVQP